MYKQIDEKIKHFNKNNLHWISKNILHMIPSILKQ